MKIILEESWRKALQEEFEKPYFKSIYKQVQEESAKGLIIYPPQELIFRAFDLCPLTELKLVILGQDPYHGPGQAMGLSFSVPDGLTAPPSLKNIFKEIESDLGIKMSGKTNLEPWARQGVLLLNSILSVRASEPGSHSRIGWQKFTDAVIQYITEHCEGIVFLLWGNYARSKAPLIDHTKHYILESAHPSPLARGAFFNCRHFSKANDILISKGKKPINWEL